MGFLAGLTQDMTLTMLVTGVTYRYPGVLAKTVTTLDVLSGGRSMFGIGAAWYERRTPGTRRAVSGGRDAADLQPDVERRRRAVRGQALSAGRDHCQTIGGRS